MTTSYGRWYRGVVRFAVVVCALAGVARAQPEADFARELQSGIALLQAGNLIEARTALTRARTIDRKAGAPHRYLAKLSEREKEWDECIDSAHEALVVDPSTDTAEMRKLHAACRSADGRPSPDFQVGEQAAVSITANLRATVKLRGEPFGGTPIAPRLVPPGRLALDIERGGYRTARVDIDALPGIVTDVRVELQAGEEPGVVKLDRKLGTLVLSKRPALLLVDGVAARVDPENHLPLSPGVHELEIRDPGKEIWRRRVVITAGQDHPVAPQFLDAGPRESRRTWSLALGGGGAVMLAVGVGFFYRSSAAKDEARQILAAEITRPVGDLTEPIRTRADFDDARSRADRNALISNLSYGAGLALLGVGIYFFATSRAPSDDDVPDLAIVPGGALIGRTLRW